MDGDLVCAGEVTQQDRLGAMVSGLACRAVEDDEGTQSREDWKQAQQASQMSAEVPLSIHASITRHAPTPHPPVHLTSVAALRQRDRTPFILTGHTGQRRESQKQKAEQRCHPAGVMLLAV